MKKSTVRLLIACLVLFGLGAGSLSAAAPVSVNANLDHRLKFRIDGRDWISPSAPLSYKGTTYLPVRAVSNALGLDIKYEAASGSIIILTGKSGASAPAAGQSEPGAKARGLEPVVAKADPNLKFWIDGAQWTPSAPPLSYKGTTYLPVRAISGALGLDIKYEAATLTINVSSGQSPGTGGNGGSAPSAAALPLFDSRYEQGGYELHTGQSDKLTYAGKKYGRVLYSPDSYQHLYVYPQGKYPVLSLQIAASEVTVVEFLGAGREKLKSVEIQKGVVSTVTLDVSKFTGDQYVTIYARPFHDNLHGEVYIFDTSKYTNDKEASSVLPEAPKTLPLFESQYEAGGYEIHSGQSDKLTYAGKKYAKVLYSPYGYQNLYVYPKGKYAALLLHIASTEAAVVRFTDDNGELIRSADVPKGTVTEIELDISKFTGDRYVTIYVEPAVSDLEGEVFIFETSHYK